MRLHEYNPIMRTNSKEQAIVEAFVGAGAAMSVARACGDGYLATECSCGEFKETVTKRFAQSFLVFDEYLYHRMEQAPLRCVKITSKSAMSW